MVFSESPSNIFALTNENTIQMVSLQGGAVVTVNSSAPSVNGAYDLTSFLSPTAIVASTALPGSSA
jgi:hypothetical protein